MLDKRAVLAVKDEVTYNTDSVPTAAANAVLVEDLKWGFANSRMFQRKPVRSSLGLLKPLYAGALITVSGKVEMKGSGAAGTAPEIAPILKAGGWAETVVASTSVTYKPSSSQTVHKSSSAYFFDDGLRLILTGGRCKTSFDFSVGQAPFMMFEYTGHFVSIADIALPAATYISTVPVPLINMPFTIGAYAALISKLAFDLGTELSIPESIRATDGYGEVQITGRNPTGSFDPQRVTVATNNPINLWQTGSALALDTGTIGSVAGNRLAVTMPAVAYTEAGRGSQNNIGTYEMKFAAAETATGDDEISIAFT